MDPVLGADTPVSVPAVRVHVLLFAAYREALGQKAVDVAVPRGTVLSGVYDHLSAREPRFAALRPFTTFALNREVVPADTEVHDGDEIAFLQPVSGGETPPMIELRYDRLSPDQCTNAVRVAGVGGIVTFVGCVRDVSEGKQIRFLEYEAYEPMAIAKLGEVIDEARERWPVRAAALQHRLGRLELGEDAVVIAIACPHRAEAFAACKYIIDRIKEVVPIWKKEHGEAGEVWVGGPTSPPPAVPSRDHEPD